MKNRYLLDTNIIIYSINSGLELPESSYYMSQISYDELLSCKDLSYEDSEKLREVLSKIKILEITQTIDEEATKIQEQYEMPRDDSRICATAKVYNLTLTTNDKTLHGVDGVKSELFYF